MKKDTVKVFFYGLFMDESLLASKDIHPKEAVVGYVEGLGLHIGERATLLPEQSGRSYGVLMEVTAEQVARLYSDPSVSDYVAESVVVNLPGGMQVAAACYNLPAAKLAGTNPGYADSLLALATKLGMPDSYLARIRTAAVPP